MCKIDDKIDAEIAGFRMRLPKKMKKVLSYNPLNLAIKARAKVKAKNAKKAASRPGMTQAQKDMRAIHIARKTGRPSPAAVTAAKKVATVRAQAAQGDPVATRQIATYQVAETAAVAELKADDAVAETIQEAKEIVETVPEALPEEPTDMSEVTNPEETVEGMETLIGGFRPGGFEILGFSPVDLPMRFQIAGDAILGEVDLPDGRTVKASMAKAGCHKRAAAMLGMSYASEENLRSMLGELDESVMGWSFKGMVSKAKNAVTAVAKHQLVRGVVATAVDQNPQLKKAYGLVKAAHAKGAPPADKAKARIQIAKVTTAARAGNPAAKKDLAVLKTAEVLAVAELKAADNVAESKEAIEERKAFRKVARGPLSRYQHGARAGYPEPQEKP